MYTEEEKGISKVDVVCSTLHGSKILYVNSLSEDDCHGDIVILKI